MCLPNATSVEQEMDALNGPFKSATYAHGEAIVMEKLVVRDLARRNGQTQLAMLNLNLKDLPTIVYGAKDAQLTCNHLISMLQRP